MRPCVLLSRLGIYLKQFVDYNVKIRSVLIKLDNSSSEQQRLG